MPEVRAKDSVSSPDPGTTRCSTRRNSPYVNVRSRALAYHAGMSRFAPLLRALLCLVLLLNGTAYAHAATRMAMGGMAAMEQAHDDAPPCHEGMDMAMQMDEAAPPPAGHPDGDAGLPDCCKAGSCDGFCTQHAPALAWPASLPVTGYLQAEAPAYLAAAHASARLSHRHRPPILAA